MTSGELRTADGQPIEIGSPVRTATASSPAGHRGRQDPAQDLQAHLDTTGDDIGEFDFCLNLPLEHPYQDSDSKNDGPEKSFEDNLKFDFKIIGMDVDGDAATGHIKIKVDDDSPKAECDVDCVTEGETTASRTTRPATW